MWFDKTERNVLWNWFQARLTSTRGSRDEIAGSRSELISSKLALEYSQTFHRRGLIEGGGTNLMWFECCSGQKNQEEGEWYRN